MNNCVVIVNDISALGNCSMAANISLFASRGIQSCPVPTAVLTNQSCYNVYYPQKYEVDFDAYSDAWHKNGFHFTNVYSGYFNDSAQIKAFNISMLGDGIFYVNDPVMGDGGRRYDNCDDDMIEQMRRVVSKAAVTTPNLTELCLLTGNDYAEITSQQRDEHYLEKIAKMAQSLLHQGVGAVVVTGVEVKNGKIKGDELYNVLARGKETAFIPGKLFPGDFSGTGDIFSSVLAADLMNGEKLVPSVEKATAFVSKAIEEALKSDIKNVNDGIHFYKLLKDM